MRLRLKSDSKVTFIHPVNPHFGLGLGPSWEGADPQHFLSTPLHTPDFGLVPTLSCWACKNNNIKKTNAETSA